MEVLTEFGANLIQVIWRKIDPNSASVADDALGDLGFDLMERGEYSLAARILKIAESMRGSKREWRRRADNVNLANAYKLMGDQTSCDKTLGKEDWSAVDHVFKASVAGVRDDVDEIVRLIKVWPETEKILTEFDFETWPVFFGVRDNPDFLAAFEARFGRKFNPAPKIRNRSLERNPISLHHILRRRSSLRILWG